MAARELPPASVTAQTPANVWRNGVRRQRVQRRGAFMLVWEREIGMALVRHDAAACGAVRAAPRRRWWSNLGWGRVAEGLGGAGSQAVVINTSVAEDSQPSRACVGVPVGGQEKAPCAQPVWDQWLGAPTPASGTVRCTEQSTPTGPNVAIPVEGESNNGRTRLHGGKVELHLRQGWGGGLEPAWGYGPVANGARVAVHQ